MASLSVHPYHIHIHIMHAYVVQRVEHRHRYPLDMTLAYLLAPASTSLDMHVHFVQRFEHQHRYP